jgi:soluble lytic murein transglycosylase-like protein
MRTRSIPLLAGGLSTLLALTVVTSSVLATDEVIVGPGDTLSAIALEHGLTVAQLVARNGLADPNRIYIGQRLVVAAPAPAAAAPAAAPPAAPAAAPRVHVVAAGEHLTGIARRYGTSIAAIVALNRISNPSFIRTGTRLAIPGGAAAAAPAPAAATPSAAMPASMAALVASRAAVGQVIAEEAQRHGVPVAFAKAVAWQESGWQQGVTSHVGAMGVMQLMPATADWVGEAMLHSAPNPRDLRWNVTAGICLLRHYLDRYHGDRALTLAAYYQGQRAVDQHGIYRVSRPYIASILVLERLFGG